MKSPGLTHLDFFAPSAVIFSFVPVMYLELSPASPILIQLTPCGSSVTYALIGRGDAPLSIVQSSPKETNS